MKYSLHTTTAIVIANMIGTGVFTSLGFQLFPLSNPLTIIVLWLLGGIIALLGSYCYAELSASFPQSGGEYHFLRIAYNDTLGFLSGWTSIIVGFSAPIALAAQAFSNYSVKFIHLPVHPTVLAISVVLLVTFVHLLHVKIGSRFQVYLTVGKIVLLTLFILAGFSKFGFVTAEITNHLQSTVWSELSLPGFWISLVYVSYAYSGWNASAYIIDDVENPTKNVPKSILTGTIIVMVLYVAVNYVFLLSTPQSEMKGKLDVAHVSANYIFGETGAILVSAMISFFLISTISSMVIVGPRVIQRMAQDIKPFEILAHKNKSGVPARSIWFQACISIILLLTGTFQSILTCTGFILAFFTTMTAIGLIILRIKKPEITRSIKVPFYPFTPILFIIFNLWTMIFVFIDKKQETMISLIFLALGWLLFQILRKRSAALSFLMIPLCITLLLGTSSCNMSIEKKGDVKNDDSTKNKTLSSDAAFKKNDLIDHNAELLCGTSAGTVAADAEPYKKHLNEMWQQKKSRILDPIEKWVADQQFITPLGQKPIVVFYPFSGPDFEFANAFYKEADTYILCGLESAGNDSSFIFEKNLDPKTFLTSAEEYFRFSDSVGFFVTLQMQKHFKERGLVDIIALYIKRSGSTIGNIELYNWNEQKGSLDSINAGAKANVAHLTFKFPSGKLSQLYYFSKDLADEGLKKDSLWLGWVSQKATNKTMVSLTKSASYLMHNRSFSIIRKYILQNSKLHIQDDSGIPLYEFNAAKRNVKLYGTYKHVLTIFKEYLQKDLAERHEKDSAVEKLPFKIGYNLKFNESSIQVMQ